MAADASYDQKADIYAPCALGATINDDTLKRLKVAVIAGGANNQLAEPRHGDALEARGMLYAPDYVINGGGAIALDKNGNFATPFTDNVMYRGWVREDGVIEVRIYGR